MKTLGPEADPDGIELDDRDDGRVEDVGDRNNYNLK